MIFEVMEGFFKRCGFPVDPVAEGTALCTTVEGTSGRWPCIAQAVEDEQVFLFYSARPDDVDESRRGAVARLLSGINYRLMIGNFEIDAADGDVRFRTSLDLSALPLDGRQRELLAAGLIESSVVANIQTMDRYLPHIDRVARGEVEPEEALRRLNGVADA